LEFVDVATPAHAENKTITKRLAIPTTKKRRRLEKDVIIAMLLFFRVFFRTFILTTIPVFFGARYALKHSFVVT